MEQLEERVGVQLCGRLCSDAFVIHHLGNGLRKSWFCIDLRNPTAEISDH